MLQTTFKRKMQYFIILFNPQDENFYQGYSTRSTAIGLCDPWVDLKMDKGLGRRPLPKIGTKEQKEQDKKPERAQTG